MFRGPEPPAGSLFCTLCAPGWKAEAIIALKSEIEAAQAADGGVEWLDADVGQPWAPQLAVAVGLVGLSVPGNAGQLMVPAGLCWSHLQAVRLLESGIMPAAAGQMPSGPGGAVML